MTEWLAWAWVIGVDLAVIVAAVFATYDRTPLASLRTQHVVAATIVAVMGWEAFANVAGALISPGAFAAVDIGFLAAQAIFAGAAGVMFFFVLRRRRWAVVLGIGLASVRFLLAVLAVVDTAQYAESLGPNFVGTVTFVLLGALPMVAAVWLFLDPFFRGQLEWRPSEPAADEGADAAEPPAEAALER
jgi:hypothetical protein